MLRSVACLSLLALLVNAGCDHDLARYGREPIKADKRPIHTVFDGGAGQDAGLSDTALGDAGPSDAADADATLEMAEAGAMDTSDTAPPAFPYAWVANGPMDGMTRGRAQFQLSCAREGTLGTTDCSYACSYDQGRPTKCTRDYQVFANSGPHQVCVTVFAPASDPTPYLTDRSEQCWAWQVAPYEFPLQWLAQTPSPLSTELDLRLACHDKLAVDPQSALREDCRFRCSLDHVPYHDCEQRFQRSGLLVGKHVFQVEVCAPDGHEADGLCETTRVSFAIEEAAQPPVEQVATSSTLPDDLTDPELGELATLLEPYGEFAVACEGNNISGAESAQDYLRTYLSIALQQPSSHFQPHFVAACRQALLQSPAPCAGWPGLATDVKDDGILPSRLPDACKNLFQGSLENGERCVTHAECRHGICERAFPMDSRTYGYCADDRRAEEGIMCRVRGCEAGLFCYAGRCQKIGDAGALCQPQLANRDCQPGLTCSGSPLRCTPKSDVNQPCRKTIECKDGLVCDRETLQCRSS